MALKNLEKNFVSAVIYVHNNEEIIECFLKDLIKVFKENYEKFEVIFVDDCSTDCTLDKIRIIAKDMKGMSISIVKLSYRQGLEAAIIAGVDIAIGDFVFEFDSCIIDYELSSIMQVYYQALKGYDVVSASPNCAEKMTSKLFYRVFEKYSKNKVQLNSERFRILSRRGINRINMLSTVIPYRKAIYFNCGLKAVNIKYNQINGCRGLSNSMSERFDLATKSLLLFTNVGSKVAIYMSLFMCSISMLGIFYTLYTYLTYSKIVEGWTTMMLFLSISFTGFFALLAIIIKYVSIILSLQFNKQPYVFEGIEKLKQ